MRAFYLLPVAAVWAGVKPAEAACTGSGSEWSCASGSTADDVQNAIQSSPDGTTITFKTGTYDLGTKWIQFATDHGTSLVCETAGGCTVTTDGTTFGIEGFSGDLDFLYRVSGFTFNSTSTNYIIWFDTVMAGSGTLSKIRIDHNTFNVPAESEVILFGDVSAVDANYYGVIDHNTVSSPGSAKLVHWVGGGQANPPASPQGTERNMFVEDNVVDNETMTNAGRGCTDSYGGAALVVRHNTFRNCLVTSHGSLHAGGPQNWELYGNTITMTDPSTQGQGVADCYRCFHHQGSGEFIAFNNTFTPLSGHNDGAMAMMYYRDEAGLAATENGTVCDGSNPTVFFDGKRDGNRQPNATYAGYPCWHQPGRDFQGTLMPMYVWGNTWGDDNTKVDLTLEDYGGNYAQHWVADRDYYNAAGGPQTSKTAPFDGTTGMGYGTLANRPTTCSVGKTDAADAGHGGVGYFATDDGPQGKLYMCSASNTWTLHYEPYVYPHPLAGGSLPADNSGGGCGCEAGNVPAFSWLPPALSAFVVALSRLRRRKPR